MRAPYPLVGWCGLLCALLRGSTAVGRGRAAHVPLQVTVRQQSMSTVGRQEWIQNNTVQSWDPARTAIVVIDMWNKHWCASATTRVGELAVPMQQWVAAARAMNVTIIWAPSDCTNYYVHTRARHNTLALPNTTLPTPAPPAPASSAPFPLSSDTDGGCDTPCKQYAAWTHQIDTLQLEPTDFLITAAQNGTQELWNVLQARRVQNIMYAGVHENMCIMDRPFAIKEVRSLGWPKERMAVVRELVDVMYTPKDTPYVSHAAGLAIHTEYVEKFWAASVSMYDILAPSYRAPSSSSSSEEEL